MEEPFEWALRWLGEKEILVSGDPNDESKVEAIDVSQGKRIFRTPVRMALQSNGLGSFSMDGEVLCDDKNTGPATCVFPLKMTLLANQNESPRGDEQVLTSQLVRDDRS
jgi:hypothetical protein